MSEAFHKIRAGLDDARAYLNGDRARDHWRCRVRCLAPSRVLDESVEPNDGRSMM